MAQKFVTTVVCDVDGTEGTPDEIRTVRFALDGTEREIDLCEADEKNLRGLLEPFKEASRVIRTATTRSRRGGRNSVSRERSSLIRTWAKAKGLPVGDKGRIPLDIVDAYDAAGGQLPGAQPPSSDEPVETPKTRTGAPRAAQTAPSEDTPKVTRARRGKGKDTPAT